MLQHNSRVTMENGIKFYEQDILYDDYIYVGDFDIALNLEYCRPGFGIGLTNSEGASLEDKEAVLLFKMGQKNIDIIFFNKDAQKVLGTFSSGLAKTYTSNLQYILEKRDSVFTLYLSTTIDDQIVKEKICTFKAPFDFETYNLIYYSDKDNVIKNINIASSIPYGWVTNMQNTNGGYLIFYRDAFEFKHCQGEAEIEQPDIYLNYGKYYLKYETEGDCDIIPYVFQSEDERIIDNKKNLLSPIDNSFTLDYSQKISLKFEGTKGKVKKIHITTDINNDYYRTSPDKGDKVDIQGSQIRLLLNKIKTANWVCNIKHAPGSDHTNPFDYSIIKDGDLSYGLFDLNLAQDVKYKYEYKDRTLTIRNLNDYIVKTVKINSNNLTINKNVNGVITELIIEDTEGKTSNIVVENTIKKYAPGSIYSPIIVVDDLDQPLNLSASYRVFKKHGKDYYWFTNVEREYFNPAHLIRLTNQPSYKDGSIIVYGIKKNATVNMDNLLVIPKEGKDTIDAFTNYYDVLFEKDLRYVNKKYKEIRLNSIEDYKMIVVDYLKEDSYAINYRHELNSYEVDISIQDGKKNKLIYNNAAENKDGITFINEYRYVNTKAIPSEDCYIVIGR